MFRSKSEDKERLKRACSTAVSGLQTTLNIAKEVAGEAGLPGLQTGIGGLLFVLDAIKKTSQNAGDVEKLSNQIKGLNRVLENSKIGGSFSAAVIERIDRLSITSNTALEELRKMASRNAIKRFIHHDDDAQSIAGYIQTMTWSMQSFTVETTLATEFALDEYAIQIRDDINSLRETTMTEFQQLKIRLDMKDGHPPYAIFASFDCKDRTRCLEGTRTDTLDQIFSWVNDPLNQGSPGLERKSEDDTTTTNTSIFWINGSAGTGKTTIAYTVAEACRKLGVLGASFFCSRDDAECSNPRLIFTSIAYQLGNFSALFRAEVTRIMKSIPDIGYSSPSYQLEELIAKPLRALGSSFPPCVVVLDALDECKDNGTTSVILSSLSLHVSELPLKFLVTSRPESHITSIFQSNELNPVTQRYVLHEVELGAVQSDIEHYLSSKLATTRTTYHIKDEWPSAADIHSLTFLSAGLFIFASTSIRFIEDRNSSNPRGQLTRLLGNAPIATELSSPEYSLDQLYTQVLNHAFPTISPGHSGRLKRILGTIVLLRDPLSSLAVERLLGVQSGTVQETLHHLHSVIMVPDDDSQVIRTLHPSFFDFITTPARCQNPKFIVNAPTQHTLLARACLDAMRELKRDICGIGDSSILNIEVEGLPTCIMTCIPPQLQYACRHWAWHLGNAMFSDVLLDRVKEFCSKYLLYWVEALSLMGDLRNGLLALDVAQKAIAKTGRDVTDAAVLLGDCERFTLDFFPLINTCSLQVYDSALLFTPEETSIKKTYRRELDIPIKLYNGPVGIWNSCIRTIEGHSSSVKSVAFSPDGTRIVSGSDDNTVRLWDAVSGAHLNTLKGHSFLVHSVAFSPDSTRIVSGSTDNTVRLWDAASGAQVCILCKGNSYLDSIAFSPDGMRIVAASSDNTVRLLNAVSGSHLKTLEGHSDSVNSVAFSPDGMYFVSGSRDSTLRLWDAASGECLNTLKGHSGSVEVVAFAPDVTHIISGSDDHTLRLWNGVSGEHLSTLKGDSFQIHSIAVSLNRTRIASRSTDNTLWLWDVVSGAHLKTLKGHSLWVNSVSLSPDGMRMASASNDNTLRLWDAVSGACLNTFKGHSDWVYSVAFSPDGTRIVSGSRDGTLRLWDAGSRAHLETTKKHRSINSVAFSPDGTRIVSESGDKTLELWDVASGAHLSTLKGHSDSVDSVAFSPDSRCIVSGSHDKTLRLWDAMSGAHLKTLKGHSSWVNSVEYSQNGTRILSSSFDSTLRMWDPVSGALLNTFKGHSEWVYSAAFSPDGTRIVSRSINTVRLWDAVSGAHLNTLKGHSGLVNSVVFSPDGMRIVTGSNDETLRLWDAVSGAHLNTLEGHSSAVFSVSFTTDGTCIVSGSINNTLRLWDAVSGAHLKTLKGHISNVESIARSCSLSQNPSFPCCPNPTGPMFGYIAEDGWVNSITRNRRICWIPISCRPSTLAVNGDRVVFGTEDGRIIVLDFTGMDSYFPSL